MLAREGVTDLYGPLLWRSGTHNGSQIMDFAAAFLGYFLLAITAALGATFAVLWSAGLIGPLVY